MLYLLAAILAVAWLLSFTAFHVTNGLVHLVLVAALIVFALQVVTGRRAV